MLGIQTYSLHFDLFASFCLDFDKEQPPITGLHLGFSGDPFSIWRPAHIPDGALEIHE